MARRFWWALAAVAVLTGAAGAAWRISHRGGFYNVSPGSVLVSADGRVITLADLSALCSKFADVVVAESPSTVTIMERTAPYDPAVRCGPQLLVPDLLTVRLRHPVGRRVLLDGTTGRPLTWFDQRRELRPTYLPSGFVRLPDMPFAFVSVPQGAVCTQVFASGGLWAITQLVGTATDSRFTAGFPRTVFRWQAVRVRGHRGWIARDQNGSGDALTWYEGGQSILIQAPSGGLYDPAAQLLAIARGLR